MIPEFKGIILKKTFLNGIFTTRLVSKNKGLIQMLKNKIEIKIEIFSNSYYVNNNQNYNLTPLRMAIT